MTVADLSDVFGANATQDISSFTISKTDLATVGLTAKAVNTPESLLMAVLLVAEKYLTQAKYDADTDIDALVSRGFSNLTTRGDENTAYRTDQINVTFAKLDTSNTLDPDDY